MNTTPDRVLITGARGLLGTALSRILDSNPHLEVSALGSNDLDITDPSAVACRFADLRPTLVINCAAYTHVDDCETNSERASRVNSDGAHIVAEQTAQHGARLIHVSTDYVFEGTAKTPYDEDAPTGPAERLCVYGRSKLLGERRVASARPDALIIRTAWLYGPDGPGFPDAILARAVEGKPLRVVNDQTGSPTHAPDLASAIKNLIAANASGILHVTNTGACTWYEFACEILRLAEIDVPITPVTTAQFPRPAKRPQNSVLDNGRYEALTGTPMRSWQAAVRDYMAARQQG